MTDDLYDNAITHQANFEIDASFDPEEKIVIPKLKWNKVITISETMPKNDWFKRNWKYIMGIVITFGLMGYLIWRSKPIAIWETLVESNYLLILSSFGGTIILFLIKTLRWKAILKTQGINIPFFQVLDLVFIGAFGSSITPAKVGDILRAVYLTKREKNAKMGTAVFSVVFDRILDFVGIFIIIGISAPFILLRFDNIDWKIPLGLAVGFVIFVVLTIAVFSERITKPILRFVVKFISKVFRNQEAKDKISLNSNEIIDDFFTGQKNCKIKNYLLLGFLSVLFWLILGLQGFLLLKGFRVENVNPLVIISVLCIAAIVATGIPTSIAGIGIRDFVIVTLLHLILGISDAHAISLSMIQTFLNVMIPGLIGGILILRSRSSKDDLKPKQIAFS
ncbi:MAG: flippase-like domain-containing protein [Candidatus Heimdallarchaeota archaeon]